MNLKQLNHLLINFWKILIFFVSTNPNFFEYANRIPPRIYSYILSHGRLERLQSSFTVCN